MIKTTTAAAPLLQVRGLHKHFPLRSGLLQQISGYARAVDGVSFEVQAGQTLALVGESGCGKTTVGRTVLRLYEKTAGEVLFDGTDIFALSKRQLRALRPQMQMIFQDPYSSLSARLPVSELIGEAVREHHIVGREQYEDYIVQVMEDCGLPPALRDRYPHQFSGGQRQRISIARALALQPRFIVCDEPVSALDVSIQAQIITLLQQLQQQRGLSYLFISHDLAVVEYIADSVGVMYAGRLVEYAAKQQFFARPLHPYSEALLSAAPQLDAADRRRRIILSGAPPSAAELPAGCRFHDRCPRCMPRCAVSEPEFTDAGEGHCVACHLYAAIGEAADE
ncbi:MAG: ABC transporter ATP-binding protein [Bacillota bacterium]|nr:ABC transporter ATP-binding protein [Bacillota bacterium]